jgi:hypothetical protein
MKLIRDAPVEKESGLSVEGIKAREDMIQLLSIVVADMGLNDERLFSARLMDAERKTGVHPPGAIG